MELQEAMAKKYSWIRDVRISFNYAETIARVLQEKGLHDRKIGVISMESLPASTYLSLQKKLPMATFSEATALALSLRFIKGKEERRLMEKAGELNDGAYQEVLKQLKPGMREYEVAGIIEGYHRGKGSDKTFNLVFSGPFPATKDGVPFQGLPWCPGQRAIEKGDCVHLEMTTVYGGYWNQLVRIIAVGLRNAELERFHQAAVATTQSGLKTMKAGMKMSEVIPSMAKTANGQGFGLTTPMGHFVGLDLIEARVDADSSVILKPGLAMILHPRLDDFRGRRIILWGETYLMTEKGPIRLTQTDDTLHTV
jgi:Xaa-Pro aminopeptidase